MTTEADVRETLHRTGELARRLEYLESGERYELVRDRPYPWRVVVETAPGQMDELHTALALIGDGGVLHKTLPGARRDLVRTNAVLSAWVRRERHERETHRALYGDSDGA